MPDMEYVTYYRMREASARDRAVHAASPSIAQIHTEMADCYARIVSTNEMVDQMALRQLPELPVTIDLPTVR